VSEVESVSRAICKAAGMSVNKVQCLWCDPVTGCTLWKEFRDEARPAIRALDDYRRNKNANSKT
jgi:hypothetical protein